MRSTGSASRRHGRRSPGPRRWAARSRPRCPDWLGSAGALAEQWAQLGADVTVVPAKPSVRLQNLPGAHFWFAGWTADYPDPDGFFRGLFEIEWPFYRDEELRELLQRARFLTDRDERMRLYHEVDRLWVAEHAAILPVAYPRMMLLRRPWIEGLWANPLSRPQLDQVEVRRTTREAGVESL